MSSASAPEPHGQAPQVDPATAGKDTPLTPQGFEEAVRSFWEKNRNQVIGVCTFVLLAIVAKEGWQHYSAARDRDLGAEFARVRDNPARLATFAEEHSGHPMGVAAYLTLADKKYEDGDYKAAAGLYQKAKGKLANVALTGRARVGEAVSLLYAGDKAAGEAALKAVAADAALLKATRGEAVYHLAALAAEAGNRTEARKFIEEVGKIEPNSVWNQRATLLLTTIALEENKAGAAAPAADAGKTPELTFKPGGK